jgi:DNA-binding NarL/FixJ family response regulator
MGFTVGIVEDDDFTRSMLVSSLSGLGHTVAIDSPEPRALLEFAKANDLDAVVLDLHLGKGPTGLDLAVVIHRLKPKIGIVMLTSYEEPRLLRSNLPSLPAGAVYLRKGEVSSVDHLEQALARAINGGESSATLEAGAESSQLAQLSDSQLEIMRLLSQGLSNSEIAKRRFITEKAVEISITRTAKILKVERNQSQNQRMNMAKAYFRALGMKLDDDGS